MAEINLDGPRLAPLSGKARHLVVFLHGYGANGDDLIGIGRQWQAWLPDTAFVSPHAPERLPQMPSGRQWFALTFRDPHERWRGVTNARPALDAFLDAELARHALTDDRLILVGFSQGTMMALHTGLRRPRPPAAIVGYSGLLVLEHGKGPESLKEEKLGRPPVWLSHGDADEVIPLDALLMSSEALAAADIPCEWHIAFGVGHGIDGEALRQGGLFAARALTGRTPS
jgi:phospholipase/carboxylesterase